jgi:hypothetical protein
MEGNRRIIGEARGEGGEMTIVFKGGENGKEQ